MRASSGTTTADAAATLAGQAATCSFSLSTNFNIIASSRSIALQDIAHGQIGRPNRVKIGARHCEGEVVRAYIAT